MTQVMLLGGSLKSMHRLLRKGEPVIQSSPQLHIIIAASSPQLHKGLMES